MATVNPVPFEELTRLASEFVTSQKGIWDHKSWMDFLSSVRQTGTETSDDMQAKLGELLEAMKEYHTAVSSTEDIENAMHSVLDESVAFIKRQKGVWGHPEWEDFLKTMQQNARTWSDGMEAYLGGVLESLKVFYAVPSAASVEEAASTPPAAPVEEPAPAAPQKVSREPSSAKTGKQSSKKKTI